MGDVVTMTTYSQCSRVTNMMSTHLSKHQLNNISTNTPAEGAMQDYPGIRGSAAGINRSGGGAKSDFIHYRVEWYTSQNCVGIVYTCCTCLLVRSVTVP